eukprot:scaffold206631_cov28-Tisochrysis_lutea.AAC.2
MGSTSHSHQSPGEISQSPGEINRDLDHPARVIISSLPFSLFLSLFLSRESLSQRLRSYLTIPPEE